MGFFFCSYNKLFRFLLKVKRTQLDLQQVWAAYMGTKHLSTAQLSNMTKIWLSRMHMAFLVDNLQYYLQVTYLQLKIFNWKEILEFALHIWMRVPTNKPIMFLLKAGKQGIWKSQLAYVVSWYETPPLPLKWNHLTLFLKGSWCSLGCVGIQVDVLEAQYSQLVEKINSTRDFESIRLAHDNFLTTLMAQSFLLMKPVSFHI